MSFEPAELDSFEPFTGKDIGFVLGIIKEGVALTGTVDGSNKDFVFPDLDTLQAGAHGFFDANMDGDVDEDDVVVYDDGVAVTVADFVESTRTATLSAAPANASVMTGDCTVEFEPYIAQSVDFSPDYEKKSFNRLRSPVKKTMFPSYETVVKVDLYTADFEVLKLAFGSDKKLLSEPLTARGYLIADPKTNSDPTRVLYIPEGRLTFPKLFSAKAGTDFAESSLELTVDTQPQYFEIPAVTP